MPPPPTRGCLDYIGHLCKTCFCCRPEEDDTPCDPGSSGANHELGPGFYITDDVDTYVPFASLQIKRIDFPLRLYHIIQS